MFNHFIWYGYTASSPNSTGVVPRFLPNEPPQWMRFYSDETTNLSKFFDSWIKGTVLEARDFLERRVSPFTDLSQLKYIYKAYPDRRKYTTDFSISDVTLQISTETPFAITQASSLEECVHNKTEKGIWFYNSVEGALYVNNLTLIGINIDGAQGWNSLTTAFAYHPSEVEASIHAVQDNYIWDAPYNSDIYSNEQIYLPFGGGFTLYYNTPSESITGASVYIDDIRYPLEKFYIQNCVDIWSYLYDLPRRTNESNTDLAERTEFSSLLSTYDSPLLSLGAQLNKLTSGTWTTSGSFTFTNPAVEFVVLDLQPKEYFKDFTIPVSGIVYLASMPISGYPIYVEQQGMELVENEDYLKEVSYQDGVPVSVKLTLSSSAAKIPTSIQYWVENYTISLSNGLASGLLPTDTCPLDTYTVLYVEDIEWESFPNREFRTIKWDVPSIPNKGLGTFD